MTKTTAELADAVLRNMGLIEANESPSAADSAFVISKYNEAFPYWRDVLELAYWTQTAIPDEVFPILVPLVQNRAQNGFRATQTLEEQQDREDILLKPLRRWCAKRASGRPMTVQYY